MRIQDKFSSIHRPSPFLSQSLHTYSLLFVFSMTSRLLCSHSEDFSLMKWPFGSVTKAFIIIFASCIFHILPSLSLYQLHRISGTRYHNLWCLSHKIYCWAIIDNQSEVQGSAELMPSEGSEVVQFWRLYKSSWTFLSFTLISAFILNDTCLCMFKCPLFTRAATILN